MYILGGDKRNGWDSNPELKHAGFKARISEVGINPGIDFGGI